MPRSKKTPMRKRVAPKKKKSVFFQSSLGRSYGITKSRQSAPSGAFITRVLHSNTILTIQPGSPGFVGFGGVSASPTFDLVTAVQSANAWPKWAALYKEYRITRFKARYVPLSEAFGGGVALNPNQNFVESGVVVACQQTGAMATYQTVSQSEGAKIFNLHRDWEWSAPTVSLASTDKTASLWDSTASPTAGYFGDIAGALTIGTQTVATLSTLGSISLEYTVQFRDLQS